MTDDILEKLVGEIVEEATARHRQKAVEYWNALRLVIDWWETNNGTDRTFDPYVITKARKLVDR